MRHVTTPIERLQDRRIVFRGLTVSEVSIRDHAWSFLKVGMQDDADMIVLIPANWGFSARDDVTITVEMVHRPRAATASELIAECKAMTPEERQQFRSEATGTVEQDADRDLLGFVHRPMTDKERNR